jgi:hypothetical protein
MESLVSDIPAGDGNFADLFTVYALAAFLSLFTYCRLALATKLLGTIAIADGNQTFFLIFRIFVRLNFFDCGFFLQ